MRVKVRGRVAGSKWKSGKGMVNGIGLAGQVRAGQGRARLGRAGL